MFTLVHGQCAVGEWYLDLKANGLPVGLVGPRRWDGLADASNVVGGRVHLSHHPYSKAVDDPQPLQTVCRPNSSSSFGASKPVVEGINSQLIRSAQGSRTTSGSPSPSKS